MSDSKTFTLTPLDPDDLDGLRAEARRVLARHDGSFNLRGLGHDVEVVRDNWGVPHIYADSIDDLFFANGFVHAQDRFWQMEVRRRLESGLLSEAFGAGSLGQDTFTRQIGLKRGVDDVYKSLDDETRLILDSYAAGVNAWIETHRDRMPIEFSLAQHTPEPWKATDIIGRGMAYNQSGIWPSKLFRARLIAEVGRENAEILDPLDPPQSFEAPEGLDYSWIGREAAFGHFRFFGFPERLLHSSYIGSNSWTVDGFASASGGPLHCSDPHMAVGHPSNWFEIHLCGAGFDVMGGSAPGTPGVVIGHNRDVVWGLTNASANVQDVYVEEFDPANPTRYRHGDGWREAEIETHQIPVRGGDPVELEVRITHHGPVVHESEDRRLGLAVAWNGLMDEGPPSMFLPILKHNRARDVDEFAQIIEENWNAPAMNFVFAGRDGRIRRISASRYPIRNKGNGLLPAPGWDPDYDWKGLGGAAEMPKEIGKRNHVILSANEKTTTDASVLQTSSEWDPGFRANRIREFLAGRRKMTVDDMAELQTDYTSLPARELVPWLLSIEAETDDEKLAHDLLAGWDFRLNPDSVAAVVYETALRKCFFILFREKLGDDVFANYLESSRSPLLALLNLLMSPDEYWMGSLGDGDPLKGREYLLRKALAEAIGECREKLGEDPLEWRWGRLHTMYLQHGAARSKSLRRLFNIGPFEMGGDIHTVNNTGASFRFGHRQVACASYRHVVDMGDLDNSRSVHIQGQSGQPESPHFDDLAMLYTAGEYHPMLFTREAVEGAAESRLRLTPEG